MFLEDPLQVSVESICVRGFDRGPGLAPECPTRTPHTSAETAVPSGAYTLRSCMTKSHSDGP